MLATIWTIIAPVLLCAGLGYGWARAGRPFDTAMVTSLVTGVSAPCLIVATLGRTHLDMSALTHIGGLALLVLFATLLVSALIVRLSGRPLRIFVPSLTFANSGNMGIPLCMLAFGELGLALALAWMMVYAVVQFSLGLVIVSGEGLSLKVLRQPILISVLVAVAMVAGDIRLPEWLYNSVKLVGDLTIPLMLITLGVSLSQLKVRQLGASATFAVVRLALGFAIGWAVVTAFNLTGTLRGVVLIESSMPVAVFNYLLARAYNQGTQEVAAMVLVSTLLSFLTLPLLLSLVL